MALKNIVHFLSFYLQQGRLRSSMLSVEGGDKDLRASRDIWRKARVEEALMRLRVAHAARALAGLDDTAFTLHKQQLQLDAVSITTQVK